MMCAFNGRIVPNGKIYATVVSKVIVNTRRKYLYIPANEIILIVQKMDHLESTNYCEQKSS